MSSQPFAPIRLDLEAAALASALAATPPGVSAALALVPEAEAARLPALFAAAALAGISLSGAIFPALVDEGGFSTTGAWLFPLPAGAEVRLIPDLNPSADAAAARIAAEIAHRFALPGDVGEPPTVLLIFDAMLPHIASVLDALYQQVGDGAELLGVNAGSERFQPTPCLFAEGEVRDGGVLVLTFPPGRRPTLAHGFMPPARSVVATATQANRVLSIDWRPALEVYQELVAATFGVELTAENFYAYGCRFPLGILRAAGDLVLRFPVALDAERALVCIGEIPPSSVLVLVRDDALDHDRCTHTLRDARQGDPSGAPHLLSFYCAGRRLHHGARALHELDSLREGSARSAGALSLGEIGALRPGGYPLFHNGAILSGAWPWG